MRAPALDRDALVAGMKNAYASHMGMRNEIPKDVKE